MIEIQTAVLRPQQQRKNVVLGGSFQHLVNVTCVSTLKYKHCKLDHLVWSQTRTTAVKQNSVWYHLRSYRKRLKGCSNKNALTNFWVGKFWGLFWLADVSKKTTGSFSMKPNQLFAVPNSISWATCSINSAPITSTYTHIHLEIKLICSNFWGGGIFWTSSQEVAEKLPWSEVVLEKWIPKKHTHTHTHSSEWSLCAV